MVGFDKLVNGSIVERKKIVSFISFLGCILLYLEVI